MLTGRLMPLGAVRQNSGKLVTAFAFAGDFDVDRLQSGKIAAEWPPRSGHMQTYPEIDRAAWFDLPTAHGKIISGQRPFLDRLARSCASNSSP